MKTNYGTLGVVLCGGQSSRMGSDKALIKFQSLPWAELAIQKLSALEMPVALSVNESQNNDYRLKFANCTCVEDNLTLDISGPLKGILSVHLQFPEKDLLVLACDMPLMKTEVLKYLVKSFLKESDEAVAFKNNTQLEPLCAIYTAGGLAKVKQWYKQGQLKRFSLHYVLENLETKYLDLPQEWEGSFVNYNSPDDLSRL